jgi:hypothetical protein
VGSSKSNSCGRLAIALAIVTCSKKVKNVRRIERENFDRKSKIQRKNV